MKTTRYVVIRITSIFNEIVPNDCFPSKLHPTLDEATQEAERLARKHHGSHFAIFQCIDMIHNEPTLVKSEWPT